MGFRLRDFLFWKPRKAQIPDHWGSEDKGDRQGSVQRLMLLETADTRMLVELTLNPGDCAIDPKVVNDSPIFFFSDVRIVFVPRPSN